MVTRDITNVENIDWTNQVISEIEEAGYESSECDVNIHGHIHDESIHCANTTYNKSGDYHCIVRRLHELERQRLEYQWMDRMTEYYWQNGIGAKGLDFLEKAGFIYTYE